MDTIKGLKRTHYCGEVPADSENDVVVGGFAARVRNKGGLIFIDLRDITGSVQLIFDETVPAETFAKAETVRSEYVLLAKGTPRARTAVNKGVTTESTEILVSELRIISSAQTPPFEITDDTKAGDDVRLKYRYLDLRRGKLQRNLQMRHDIARITREYFYENRFTEIETPFFIKSTPEGARDYLVPARLHAGKFYALPQSPQIYKQLLMIAGIDRYIQLARCFRDEDLRADRQPEFTQIDMEMSFVDVDDVLEMVEGFIQRLMRDLKAVELPAIPRITYTDAMNRFGSDKPDTRFAMEIQDITEAVRGVEFPVFQAAIQSGGTVRGIVAKSALTALTRKEIDKLVEYVKGIGAKGLAYIRCGDEISCSFGKFLKEGEIAAICTALSLNKGDVALICADRTKTVLSALGALRLQVAKNLNLVTSPADRFNFLWITEMPFFEYNEETGGWDAMHHPFTMPMDDCLQYLDTDKGKVFAKAYDLVLNGVELCSGSIRITDFALQEQMFRSLGLTPEEIEAKFGFLVDAYRYGAPPHGGMGMGLDRLAMVLCGADSLRDVTAFPKTKEAVEPMSDCPATVSESQLTDLHIKLL
jgi:aspartyl-tRNA synthetase